MSNCSLNVIEVLAQNPSNSKKYYVKAVTIICLFDKFDTVVFPPSAVPIPMVTLHNLNFSVPFTFGFPWLPWYHRSRLFKNEANMVAFIIME